MCRINQAFEGELTIRVSGGIKERRGPGDTLHRLILVYKDSGACLCCTVNPNKADGFMRLIRDHKDAWKVRKYELCESNDRYFDSLTACTRRLHGVRMTEEELAEVCRECGVRRGFWIGSPRLRHRTGNTDYTWSRRSGRNFDNTN